MPFVQQAFGTWNGGTSFIPTLPAPSSAANRVGIVVAGNNVVSTPSGFTLRASQVNFMGHYLWDRAGGAASYTFPVSGGQGVWWMFEIPGGGFDVAQSSNNSASFGNYSTPNLTPTAGPRLIIASMGGTSGTGPPRTLSGWTNSFVEQFDTGVNTADFPMHAGALLDGVTANGTTAYSTTATFNTDATGRTAIIASYSYTVAGPTFDTTRFMPFFR